MFRRFDHKNRHLGQDELALAANGGRSLAERGRVSAHLALCSDCASQVDQVRRVVDALHRMPSAAPLRHFTLIHSPTARRTFAPRLSVALTAAGLAALAVLVATDLSLHPISSGAPLPQIPVATPGPRPVVIPGSESMARVSPEVSGQPKLEAVGGSTISGSAQKPQRFRWWPWELALAALVAASAASAVLFRRASDSR